MDEPTLDHIADPVRFGLGKGPGMAIVDHDNALAVLR